MKGVNKTNLKYTYQIYIFIFFRVQPLTRPSRLNMMAFCPEHPKWDQNPKFTPLSKTTSIPTPFICGVPPRVLGISLPNCATECAKNSSGTWQNMIFNTHLKTWAMWFSNLFIVFSFRFIQLIASCRQSSRAHYRTLTGSIVRKLIDLKPPRVKPLCDGRPLEI